MIPVNSSFFNWMMDVLRALAGLRSAPLDFIMQCLTKLGHEALFVVVACTLLYCVDKQQGYRFLFMFNFGQIANQALKVIFAVPRPWVVDPAFKPVEAALPDATGWSFPSGHTQSAVMMYGGLARTIRKWWGYLAAAILSLLIGFTRMYLGVHTPLDVAAGLVLGVAAIAFSDLLFSLFGNKKHFIPVVAGICSFLTLAYLVAVIVFDKASALYADDVSVAATLFGLSFGAFCGCLIERRFINFDVKAVWWVQIIKVALGLGLMLGLRAILKYLFGLIPCSVVTKGLLDGVRYFIMIFAGLAVYPFSFRVLVKLDRKSHGEKAGS